MIKNIRTQWTGSPLWLKATMLACVILPAGFVILAAIFVIKGVNNEER